MGRPEDPCIQYTNAPMDGYGWIWRRKSEKGRNIMHSSTNNLVCKHKKSFSCHHHFLLLLLLLFLLLLSFFIVHWDGTLLEHPVQKNFHLSTAASVASSTSIESSSMKRCRVFITSLCTGSCFRFSNQWR